MLYEQRPGADDAHTTDAFLEALVVNATVARRSYLQASGSDEQELWQLSAGASGAL